MFQVRSITGAMLYACIFVANSTAQVSDQDIDRAVLTAKTGRPADALRALREIVAANPTSLRAARDRVVVANWAEAHEEALSAHAALVGDVPAYVHGAAALSARRLGRFERAEQLYRVQLMIEPNQREAQAGVVLSRLGAEQGLAAGDAAQAAARAEQAAALALGWLPVERSLRATREWVPLLEALAVTRERQQRYTEALTVWQTLLQAAPDSRVARRAMLFIASRLGAASVAESMVRGLEAELDATARMRVRQDATATAIRWGEAQAGLDGAVARYGWTDRGLSSNATDRIIAPPDSPLERNAAFDRMIALRDRVLMRDAIALYRSLVEAKFVLPGYVIAAAADAYLYERQPAVARDLYQAALMLHQRDNAKPNREWQFALMWALLECEDWKATHDLVDALWTESSTNTKLPNPDPAEFARLTRASIVQALARLYADELRPSYTLLRDLRDLAPHNLSIRAAYAAWLQSNGMRFESNELLRQTIAEDGDYLTARIALADSEFGLSRFSSARERIAALVSEYPENRAVQRSHDTIVMHDAPELRVSTSLGAPRGDRAARREWRLDAMLYSPPIYENYRAFAHLFDASAALPVGGAMVRTRLGFGGEMRREGLDMTLELHRDVRPKNDRLGVALQLSLWPSDLWRVRAGVDSNTLDIPLRATQAGVFARKLSLEMSTRYAYLRGASLGMNAYRFSDGNNRLNLAAAWRQRLIEGPVYRLDGDIGAYASSNSRSDVAYFSPRHDASVELSLTNEWRTWRFYEDSFMQRLGVSVGEYWQHGFAGLPTLSARYEHEWDRQRNYVLRYGVSWSRRPYDGKQETRTQGYLDLGWRLR
jgi:biofilm PGA synthesis protein PgaA